MPIKLVNFSEKENGNQAVIFCPHAGGSPNQYRIFSEYFPSAVNLSGVMLPGRNGWNVQFPKSLHEAADALANVINKKANENLQISLFGHSMGALLAYETAKRLGSAIKHLFVSGHVAPHIRLHNTKRYALNDQALKNELLSLSGTQKEIIENSELMDLLLPAIRNDFMLCDTYQFQNAENKVLSCPITAFGSIDDDRMCYKDVEIWSEYTSLNFESYRYAGSHFFIFDHVFSIVQKIMYRLEKFNQYN